jgi:hypothetical protein
VTDETPAGPLYLLDHGVKATAAATVSVGGRSGDAALRVADGNAGLIDDLVFQVQAAAFIARSIGGAS